MEGGCSHVAMSSQESTKTSTKKRLSGVAAMESVYLEHRPCAPRWRDV